MGWSVLPYVVHCLFHYLLLLHFPSYTSSTSLPLCKRHDSSALLQFKNSLALNTSASQFCYSSSNKTASWENGTNCCQWDGVTCDTMSGHVIGLNLSCSNLQGTLHPNSTLFHLTHLQQLNLASNDFSGSSIYSGIGDLVSLTHLDLSDSSFGGNIPSTISHLSKLVSLDLSNDPFDSNFRLRLDPSTWNKLILNATHLEELVLNLVNMSGQIPNSIGHLKSLNELSLSNCGLDGLVPLSLWNLTKLTHLNLASNMLSGEIPSLLSSLKHLTSLELDSNNFSGQIPDVFDNITNLEFLVISNTNLGGQLPSSLFDLTQLRYLILSNNNFEGPIPCWRCSLPSLWQLDLSNNKLTGPISEFSAYSLGYLSLSNNMFQGKFPNFIFEFENLEELHLSSTNLSGLVDFHRFSKFKNFYILDLSHNNFLLFNIDNSADYILPNLTYVTLSFCNLTNFPQFLARLHDPLSIDVSNNKIHGKIPKLFYDNLLLSWKRIEYIDLSFNKLEGDLPIPPYGTGFFFVSNNNLTGDISVTLCNASSLWMLNLSHNNLTGMIPQCLGTLPSFYVMDLQMNNLHGSIPTNFSKRNAFETIKLNGNLLDGPLPKSLAHCTNLQVLDLGDNYIQDVFPSWLETLPELQVLVLRANKFHGPITTFSAKNRFPMLRIFDVSNNNFSGSLPASFFKSFLGMMNLNDNQTGLEYVRSSNYVVKLYNDSVVVSMKGLFVELKRILTTFTTIDLSNNMFEGEIPQVIGELNSLKGLNLSRNAITGTIPTSLGNLRSLEWLDLSWNQLRGEIPMALTNLNFLSFLNLSQNQLEGVIPTGKQFNTFENVSYGGNPMLCGTPLSRSCSIDEERPPSTIHREEKFGFGWKPVAVGYACGMVFGMLLGCCFCLSGKPLWLARFLGMPNKRVKRGANRVLANRRTMN